ncbi:helical hairpin domain-containing protein [Lactococcus petauri]
MTGETLMKQLCLYNGTIPVKKEPVISSLHELVEAMNFLIEHGVNEGKQMENLEKRLENKIQEAQERLEELDEKIMNLHQSIKDTFSKEGGNEKITSSSEELQQELISSRLGRKVLVQELENAKNEFNQFREIEYSQIKSIK